MSHLFYISFQDNMTLIGELNEKYHNYFSLAVLYETQAGAGHYLTLVHARYMVNDTVLINE